MDLTANVELPDLGDNIIRTYDLDNPNPKGLGHELYWCMKERGNDIAQIDAETGYKETYKDFLTKCVRTAIAMKNRGITYDDIISPCTLNHLDSCVPFVAALFLGVKVASLDPKLGYNDNKHLLKQIVPKIIFTTPDWEQYIEDVVCSLSMHSEIVVFGESKRHTEFSEFLKPSEEENDFKVVEVNSSQGTAVIFFSSGVTGLPKGICTSHYALLSQMNRFRSVKTLGVQLLFYSLYGLNGGGSIIGSILIGTTRIVCPSFDPHKMWQYIETYGVTSTFLSPIDAMSILKLGRPKDVDTSTLRIVTIGSGSISSKHLLDMKNIFPGATIMFAYGQTEVAGSLTCFNFTEEDMDLMLRKGNSVGKPIRGYWYKVVDPNTEEILGPNQKGELRVRTKLKMNGYYNLNSSEAFDAEGWLKTGDICYYDEDHCFFIVDRIKEMFKYRSSHVTPALLEGVLHQHPAVKVAVVIGVPHEEDENHALGLVVLSKDAGDVTPEELEKYVAERVPEMHRLYAGVRFIEDDDIPYTPTGKVKRNLLRRRILEDIT